MHRRIVPDIISKQELTTVPASMTVREAGRQMTAKRIGALMVMSNDRLEGIFTERDVMTKVVAPGRNPDTTTLADVMTRNPDTVAPDSLALRALEMMRESGYRHLPVVEPNGRLVGIVSIRDLYFAVKTDLEEDLQEREAFLFGSGYGTPSMPR
ncbi:MAG: CBS domain-containing protein [Alphaproteobacteria bacterium]|nr:CBS domain-containing protein [Alphaproteobacteria bacterium]